MAADAGTSTYWERVAESRWGEYVSDVERRAILAAHEMCAAPGEMLEIGAEGGRWSRLLTDLGWHATCTDVDEAALAACQARIPSATCVLVQPEDESLPAASGSMRMVLCIEVPPVVQSDWFLSEAHRVVGEDGVLVAVVFNRASVRGALLALKARLAGGYDYYRMSYGAWRRRLKRAGYSVVREEGYCWMPFSRASDSALVPTLTRLERVLGLNRVVRFSPWVAVVARRTGQ